MDYLSYSLKPENLAAVAKATGTIPATDEAAALIPAFANGGANRIFMELSRNYAVMRPETPAYPFIATEYGKAVQDILAGADPQDGAGQGGQGHRRQHQVQRRLQELARPRTHDGGGAHPAVVVPRPCMSTENPMTTTHFPPVPAPPAQRLPAVPPSKPRRRPRYLREQISGWGMIAPAAILLLALRLPPGRSWASAWPSPTPGCFAAAGRVRRRGQLRPAVRGSHCSGARC